jgi:hypothetical protein
MSEKVIWIDDAGWGDLILGVVIGAIKPPNPKYMERRIPVSSFQPPNFENKKYLDDTVKIADEIVEVMHPDDETRFKVCSARALTTEDNDKKYVRCFIGKDWMDELIGLQVGEFLYQNRATIQKFQCDRFEEQKPYSMPNHSYVLTYAYGVH